MDKQAFMQELEHRLRHLTDEDKFDALEYYNEYIDDLNLPPEADICRFLGTPREIARQIIDQTVERKIDEQQEKNTTKGAGKVIWLSILGICASPIALPLLIVALLVLIVILAALASILISLYAAGGSLALGGIACAVLGLFSGSLPTILVQFGVGFFMTGLGILIILGSVRFTKLIIRIIIAIVRSGINRRKRNREVNIND